jgi:hypothetical protein
MQVRDGEGYIIGILTFEEGPMPVLGERENGIARLHRG